MDITTESETLITITENAADQVKSLLAADPENVGKSLRIHVEAGGCSGLKYGLVFDEQRAQDLVIQSQGVTVVVDAFSAKYLRGSVVDFVDSLTGGGFKIANPNAHQSCGCGKSFEA